ncbi:MAG TPA: PKD domain-containing protein [Bacteroidia bacterium]|nr:PKD domain-containing protein [Bacteroidia bacterium]
MKNFLIFCFIATISISKISAQCMLAPVLLNQRISNSSDVIEGKVINQVSFWDQTHSNIYTSNLVEVYKSFKSSSAPYIEVISEGGTVGLDKEEVHPSLELSIGDIGVFTLNQNSLPSQFGKSVYEAYGSSQGFIRYNVTENEANEPFEKYTNINSTLYNKIQQLTQTAYTVVKPVNPFFTLQANTTQNVAATITSFSPTTITAGTFSIVTINGTGFGTTQGTSFVEFKRADDGGATFCRPDAWSYVSWSDTQIQVRLTTTGAGTVNSTPGTGVIRVDVGGVKTTSTSSITVTHAQINVYSNGSAPTTIYNTRHVAKQSGGYVWQMFTGFDSNASAKASFLRAFQSWRCGTYINWTAGPTTTVNTIANDGVNVIRFDVGTELPAGVLGRCTSRFSGCGTQPNQNWFVNELDIVFDDGTTWNYGPAAPTFSQYDFESVAVHELGHGHQLGHVINSAEIMNYSIANGQSKRVLSVNDLAGGNAIMARNLTGGVCAIGTMTALTSSNCALGAPTANFSANRTTVCPGQTVVFTDLSTGTPTVLAWTFAGGTPSTSAVSSPTITYNTPGTYSVQLVATNANGSSTYSVTAYINVVSPATLPLVQDFQSVTYPPTNWYLNDAGNDNIKWKLATNAGYNSTQSTVFDNWSDSITPTRDELKTYVNLSGFSSAKMTFYRSYSQTFGTPYIDSLQIGVSTNCGTSTTYPYLKGGSQLASATTATSSAPFTPTASTQWVKDSVDLTPYVGQANVMIAFINRGHYGDAIYLDNINITGVAATTPTASITSASVGCTGTSITLTDASTGGPTSWTWTMAGGTPSVATTQNTSVTYSTAGVKTITLTVANGTGTTTATKTITITATPTVAASVTNTTICSGGSVVETLTGATTYTWLPNGSGTTSTLTPTSTTIYTITGSTGGCVSAVRNVTVTVTQNPTVNIVASSSTICAGQTATLTASGATAYAWLPGAQTTTVITVTPTITTTYTVNGSVGTCYGTKTISINVTSTPTVASSITNTTICSGTSVIANVTGATTYTWLPSGSGNTSTLTPSSTTVYTVTGSNGSCVSAPKNFTINVTTTPTVNITASSSTVCAGQTVTLTASGATAYSWLPGAQTTTVITVNPTGTTSYTVNGANGTCYGTKTITINVSSTPTIATSITNTTICNGKSVIASVTGATTYTWLPSGSGNTSTLTPSSTTVYTVTGSNGSCVSSPKTFTVNVNSNPVLSNTTTNVTCFGLCNGSTTITATGGSAPYVYTLVQGTPICTSTTCNNLCAGAYTINVTDINGCTGTSNITISQPTQLVATISNTNATCSSCTDGAASVLASGGTPAYTYSWTPLALTTPNASSLAVGCYTATVVDANGCVASATTCISFGTGIYENQTADIFSIYPNPTKGIITITTSSIFEKVDIEITNTLGQTVKTETLKNIQQTTVDMSNLSKGIYYVKVSSPEGTKLSKLILE